MGFGWSNTRQSPSFFICHCPADTVLHVGQGIVVNNRRISHRRGATVCILPILHYLYCTILTALSITALSITALSILHYLYCTIYTIHSPEGARPLETPPENEGTK